MQIHLIGGFLGSGKTTAIHRALRLLTDAAEKVAVITNDQGNQLVDTRFLQQSAYASTEVTGGCFCCNYADLDASITRLENEVKPTIIFAETVGSCTDLVATVLKPLLQLRKQHKEEIQYSVFVDATLLLNYLQTKTLPFLPETNYIWEKQLEEAGILVINKCDLVKDESYDTLIHLAGENYPDKKLLFQNSLDDASVADWLKTVSDTPVPFSLLSVNVDYATYATGEANMAWLDVELEFFTGNLSAGEKAAGLIRRLGDEIRRKEIPVGHLKFFVVSASETQKISFTTLGNADFMLKKSDRVQVLVNARVQAQPASVRHILEEAINETRMEGDIIINQKNFACFKPGYPKPAYRMA